MTFMHDWVRTSKNCHFELPLQAARNPGPAGYAERY